MLHAHTPRHPLALIGWILLLGAAYFVIGRASLLLALPPGFSSPIWPAAGVALLGVVWLGRWGLLGVALGSIATNVTASLATASAQEVAGRAWVFLIIGCGAATQAAAGAWWLRRTVEPGEPVDGLREISRCQAGAGPVACLIGATVGVVTLTLAGVVPAHAAGLNWCAWWIGDTIGVLLLLPVLLMPRLPVHSAAARLAPLGVAMVGTAIAYVHVRDYAWARVVSEFEREAETIAERLEREVAHALEIARSIVSLFDASERVERGEFETFVGRELDRSAAITGLGWAPRVPSGGGFPVEFLVARGGETDPALFDLSQTESGRGCVSLAARDGAPRIAAPPAGVESGLRRALICAPVYASGSTPVSVPAREADLAGVAMVTLDLSALIADATPGGSVARVAVLGRDVTAPRAPVDLFGERAGAPGFEFGRTLEMGGRRWSLEFRPTASYLRGNRLWEPWALVVGGMMLCVLLGDSLLLVTWRERLIGRRVAESTKELLEANELLECRSEELERFAYTVTHDLRTPLLSIQGFADLLREELQRAPGSPGLDFLGHITDGSAQMERTINDLLALSRLGRVVDRAEPVDTGMLAGIVVDSMSMRIRDTGSTVTVQPDMPTVLGDEGRVNQVLQNLVENALKYGAGEGGAAEVRVGGERRGDRVVLWVADNGPGIAREYQRKVFGLFNRLSTQSEGTGIGLAIVERVAIAHGGSAWVESTPGEGATFYVSFDAREDRERRSAA